MIDHIALYRRLSVVVMAILKRYAESRLRANPNIIGYTKCRILPGVEMLQSGPERPGSFWRACEHRVGQTLVGCSFAILGRFG